jgi:predicted acyltransferase
MASPATTSQRLASLDFLRGLIMILLALESAGLYYNLLHDTTNPFWHSLWAEFTHYPWHGLHFWDLIQPGFMFIAGTAMALSLHKQQMKGVSWRASFLKMLRRCAWLFFFGVLDYAVRPQGLSFELWDVLTQLSFTMMVAFLIFRWPVAYQLLFSLGLLVLTEILYRYTHVPGFDQPFTDQHNFGNYMDLILMNKINKDGWVAINCIPTAAHTIWGAVAGKISLSNQSDKRKVSKLIIGGIICLALGFGLDRAGITPIIKRIATSSFILASGGWCLLGLAFCYWWIDMLNHKKYILFFTIVGMNSIFIYLFFEIVGDRWFNGYVAAITNGLMGLANVPVIISGIITSFCIFMLEWLLLYFLYKKKIFLKV